MTTPAHKEDADAGKVPHILRLGLRKGRAVVKAYDHAPAERGGHNQRDEHAILPRVRVLDGQSLERGKVLQHDHRKEEAQQPGHEVPGRGGVAALDELLADVLHANPAGVGVRENCRRPLAAVRHQKHREEHKQGVRAGVDADLGIAHFAIQLPASHILQKF